MSACNNGHFWMFHNDSVKAKERMDATGMQFNFTAKKKKLKLFNNM